MRPITLAVRWLAYAGKQRLTPSKDSKPNAITFTFVP
jgi:hypothetical protein